MFAVLFAFQLLYQHIVLEYAASYGATRGAMMWDYKDYDFFKGTVGEKVGIYNNLDQMLTKKGISERENKINQNTKKIVDSLTILGGNVEVKTNYKNSIVGRSVVVEVKQDINIPFKALFTYFNDGDMKLTARSSASLYDPDEYIRNIDYVYELADSIISQVSEKFDEINKKRKS
jgi:hypothetical protein